MGMTGQSWGEYLRAVKKRGSIRLTSVRRASGVGHQADREKLRKLNGRRTSFVRQGGDSGGPGQSAHEGTEEHCPEQAFHLHGWSGDDLLNHPAWRAADSGVWCVISCKGGA